MASTELRRRLLLGGVAVAMAAAGAALGGFAWQRQPPKMPTPTVTIGDGVSTPKGMAWIPPGVFLMGSDSKLAQPNEARHTLAELENFSASGFS